MNETRILIADDHAPVRRSVRALLESHPGWSICGEASNGREAVEQARHTRPDVILLDVSMPELDGLQATREILRNDPGAQVIILTMHHSDEMEAQAARAGARDVIAKSSAHERLIAAIESVFRDGEIHLAGDVVGTNRHIAALFHSRAEHYRVMAPFIDEGLTRGEKALHFIEPPDRDMHLQSLLASGVDLARAEARGTARLMPSHETYLRGNRFDQYAMLDLIQDVLRDGSAERFPRTRLIARMEWALSDAPGVEDLAEYESRLNNVLPAFRDVVVCAYDVTRFSASVIVDIMRAHPMALVGECLRENPFYMPPEQMIGHLERRAGADHAR